jgi:flagellar hook-associated protein 3 FlgL
MLRPESISTLSLRTTSLEQLQRSQSALVRAQAEQASGRHHDAGLVLGYQVGRNLDWHGEINRIGAQTTRNDLAGVKAALAQDAMDGVRALAQGLVATLAGAQGASNGRALAQSEAQAAWGQLVDLMAAAQGGQHVFSGINSDQPPLSAYQGSSGAAAVATAFQSAFGISQTDPAARLIAADDLKDFLAGDFASLFDEAGWQASWSAAASATQMARPGAQADLDIAVSANAEGFRAVAQGIAMVMDLAKAPLNDGAFRALADEAMARLTQGIDGITREQSRVGLAQQALKQVNDRLHAKRDYLTTAITTTEGVDQTEVAMRINTLMTQLEAGYAITSRLSRLSLLNYLT